MDYNLINLHAEQLEQVLLSHLSGPIPEQVATLRELARKLEIRAMTIDYTHQQANEFAVTLQDRGVRAEVLDPSGAAVGVNVWKRPEDRYPADTVWFYYTNPSVLWGPSFEHTTNAEDPSLVDRVIETVRGT